MKDLLPNMEFEFTLDKVKGSETNLEYSGKFKYKRLDISKRSNAAKMRASMDGGLDVPIEVSMLHEMISWLKYGLTEWPKWWEEFNFGLELYDINIVEYVYKQIKQFEDEWYTKLDAAKK